MVSQRLLGSLLSAGSLSTLAALVVGNNATPSRFSENLTIPPYVTQYAPLLWLYSDDPFRPSDLLRHIHHTTPMLDERPLPGLPELNLDNLAILNEFGDQVCLTSNDDPTTLPEWFFGETPDSTGRIKNAVPCTVILVEKNSRDIDAFFFYFYSYDRGANITQVLKPLDRLIHDDGGGMHFGDHVGDWENNMVRFVNGEPTGIYYSQHSDGRAYSWHDPGLSKVNGRPLVYSAYGSHANYASVGDHVHDAALVDYCDAGYQWDPILSAYFYHFDPSSSTLTPLTYEESSAPIPYPTSFFEFTGKWGDLQYSDDDPRQKTVPRFNLKRFNTGPTGPYAKNLVRKGLYPDKRHKKSWIEWGVLVFMAVYPCCFKGWRVWVSGIAFIAVLASIAFATRYAIRRYLRRGYKMVDTEIPLADLERYD